MHSLRLYSVPFRRRLSHSAAARLTFVHRELQDLQSLSPVTAPQSDSSLPPQEPKNEEEEITRVKLVEIAHPWPEWTDLVEILFKRGYLDPAAFDGPKNSNLIRTASLNFARDRFDLIRYFSRSDIHIMSGAGCPSLDRKVVNSGKRLRAHVGIDEGHVCSSCTSRGSCERAYVKAREDEGGRTVDVMRFLLTYGLDLTTGSLDNQASFSKIVKASVRKLMNEMVVFSDKEFNSGTLKVTSGQLPSRLDKKSIGHQIPQSQKNVLMKQGDWICPKCNFMNFAKNIKCLCCDGVFQERLDKLQREREHLPLKKGDWICEKCNFLNFAKNTRCLQCKEKPLKRQLNPGEWECVSCNYINFRKNMVCLKCDWKRPKASTSGDVAAEPHQYLKHSGMSFVRDSSGTSSHHIIQQTCSSEEKGTNFWSCEEDETDDDNDHNSWNRFANNFPVVGGKSDISKDLLVRERWKRKMSRSRGISLKSSKENADEMDHYTPAGAELDESGDEDDIAGWFRKKSWSYD